MPLAWNSTHGLELATGLLETARKIIVLPAFNHKIKLNSYWYSFSRINFSRSIVKINLIFKNYCNKLLMHVLLADCREWRELEVFIGICMISWVFWPKEGKVEAQFSFTFLFMRFFLFRFPLFRIRRFEWGRDSGWFFWSFVFLFDCSRRS